MIHIPELKLEFKDSCNCLCRREIKEDDPLFIDKNGQIKRFKRVPNPSESHVIVQGRVEERVKQALASLPADVDVSYMRFQAHADIDFASEREKRSPVTLEKIRRMESAILELRKEYDRSTGAGK